MSKELQIFNKVYDDESLSDLERDVMESFDPDINAITSNIPVGGDGFRKGTFKVSIIWEDDE